MICFYVMDGRTQLRPCRFDGFLSLLTNSSIKRMAFGGRKTILILGRSPLKEGCLAALSISKLKNPFLQTVFHFADKAIQGHSGRGPSCPWFLIASIINKQGGVCFKLIGFKVWGVLTARSKRALIYSLQQCLQARLLSFSSKTWNLALTWTLMDENAFKHPFPK